MVTQAEKRITKDIQDKSQRYKQQLRKMYGISYLNCGMNYFMFWGRNGKIGDLLSYKENIIKM